jgi:hypothetical protein
MDCRRAKEVERGCGQQTAMNANREELLFQLALMKPAGERAEFLDRECAVPPLNYTLHRQLRFGTVPGGSQRGESHCRRLFPLGVVNFLTKFANRLTRRSDRHRRC